jgi:hypothetical protein
MTAALYFRWVCSRLLSPQTTYFDVFFGAGFAGFFAAGFFVVPMVATSFGDLLSAHLRTCAVRIILIGDSLSRGLHLAGSQRRRS